MFIHIFPLNLFNVLFCFQISHGPVLYIPFINPENLKDYCDGQQDLPQQVTESYRDGGKFVFQRGKSWLYTTSNEAVLIDAKGPVIEVVILNCLCNPPVLLGTCETGFTTFDQTRLQYLLRGKLSIFNSKREIVAQITLSVAFRNLGKDVALHAYGLNKAAIKRPQKNQGQSSYEFLGLIKSEGNSAKLNSTYHKEYITGEDTDAKSTNRYELTKISRLLKQGDFAAGHDVMENDGPNVAQNSGLEKCYELNLEPRDSHSKHTQVNQEPSELIAAKIADFDKNVAEGCEDNWSGLIGSGNHGRNIESSYQPSPILYTNQNTQAERLWHDKMLKMEMNNLHLIEPEVNHLDEPEIKIQRKPKVTRKVKSKNKKDFPQMNDTGSILHDKHKTKIQQHKDSISVSSNSGKVDERKSPEGLRYPTGWLRSTPVATFQTNNHLSYPKLNRTVFLRRMKLEPQLSHLLHAEISYRVKQKLKLVDERFETEFTKIKTKRLSEHLMKRRVAVACQTVPDHEDNVQDTGMHDRGLSHHDSTSSPGIGIQSPAVEYLASYREKGSETEILEETGHKPRESKIAAKNELRRNLTYDVEDTENNETNVLKNNDNYEEDFEFSESQSNSISESGETSGMRSKSFSQAEVVENKSKRSSLSLSGSETKYTSRKEPTSNVQKSSLKDVKVTRMLIHSDTYIKEPSLDPSLTFTVCKEIPLQNENKHEATTSIPEQNSSSQPVQVVLKDSNNTHKLGQDLRPNNRHSARTSEVSGASDLSAEVFQEILKGRKADFLTRNGSQFHYSDRVSLTHEEIDADDELLSSVSENCAIEEHLTSFGDISEKISSRSQISNLSSVSAEYITDFSNSLKGADNIRSVSISTIGSNENQLFKSEQSESDKCDDKLSATTLSRVTDKYNIIHSISENSPSYLKDFGRTTTCAQGGVGSVGSSISDISARIAALLMPKRVSVAHLNTDSVSSYIPSEVSNTLSSLSDMTGN